MSRPLVPGLVAEGDTDEVFLGRVIARQLRALTDFAPRPVDVQSVQYAGCRMTRDDGRINEAIAELAADCHLIFLHSDHRERGKADRLAGGPVARPVVSLVPVKETEAWLLADRAVWERVPGADTGPLPRKPREAERLPDPKAVLDKVLAGGRPPPGRRALRLRRRPRRPGGAGPAAGLRGVGRGDDADPEKPELPLSNR
ncbi:hypothetical protein [Nonomuraea sp. NPDC048826]|uniref:hypothetical protein n=1 Tax=Nonomuraea sp. NPDC048826 TaxID=3364347 RepID=UPI0037187DD5